MGTTVTAWLRIMLFLLGASLAGVAANAQTPAAPAAQEHKKVAIPKEPVDYAARERGASPEMKAKLAELRKDIAAKKRKYTVGYTSVADIPLDVLASTKIPKALPAGAQVYKLGRSLKAIDDAKFKQFSERNPDLVKSWHPACSPKAKSWDWRKKDKVTSVRAQVCGTCWDFTAMGAYEASYAIRNGQTIDASEQYVLNCANAGNCAGGWWMPVFDFLVTQGTATEAADPFTGDDTLACPAALASPYRASAWSFVAPDTWNQIPPTDAVKASLCEHGPLAVAVEVDSPFTLYTGGVFDETGQSFPWINHGVVLIGWDDSKGAWLIKNSWGPGWGETGGYGTERGYMWIAYGSNNVGIAAAWVDAARPYYKLPDDWKRTLEDKHVAVKPLPEPNPGPYRIKEIDSK